MATYTQLASANWRVQVRRKTRFVAETFQRHKEGEEWALEIQRNIDRNGSSRPRATRNVRTFGHTKLESTVQYLGIAVDDAPNIAEQIEL